MRNRSQRSGLRAWIATILLVCVPGCLFAQVVIAAAEFPRAELDIDLSDPTSWKIRARGELRYEVDGKIILPWITEGFASKRGALWRHRSATASPDEPSREFRSEAGEGLRFRPAELGYRPGERIEVEYEFQVEAGRTGQLDQAFVLGGHHAGGATIRVQGDPHHLRREIQGFRELPVEEVGTRAERRYGWPAQAFSRIWFDRIASHPRLLLTTYTHERSLADAIQSELRSLPLVQKAIRPTASFRETLSRIEPIESILRDIARLHPLDEQGHRPIRQQMLIAAELAEARSNSKVTPLEWAIIARHRLAQAGWDSQIVLSNRRAIPREPGLPVALFDTAILYIPELRRFLDPSTGSAAGFALSPAIAGHAGLILDPDGAYWTRLPFGRADDNRILTRAELQVGPDGSIAGQSMTDATGEAAIQLRQLAERVRSTPKRGGLAELMERQGLDGTAHFGPSEDEGSRFMQHLLFHVASGQSDDLARELALNPGPRLYRPPLLELLPALQDPTVSAVPCKAMRIDQEVVFHLPDRRVPSELPSAISMETRFGTFRARYRSAHQRLVVERTLEIRTPDPVCTREVIRDLAPIIRAASRDFARKLQLRSPGG